VGGSIPRIDPSTGAVDSIRNEISGPSGDPDRMKLLAIDLSSGRGSLAWFEDVVASSTTDDNQPAAVDICDWPNDRKNSTQFFESLGRTVQEFGSPRKIIIGLGPGSYAGIRIAISAAIGLQATGATLIGYPSVCAFDSEKEDYAVVGDARRQSFFFVRVTNRRLVGGFELHDAAGLNERIQSLGPDVSVFSSDSLPQFEQRVQQKFPSAEILGQLAINSDRIFVRPPLEPLYLREASVTIPKPLLKRIGR
jgi:tRNA threonylcarbamoyladenosine biosynthesis protein TsaB